MREDLHKIFFRHFNTPEGQQILSKLDQMFSENTDLPNTQEQMAYERGQRSVMKFIHNAIKRGEKT